MPPTLFKCFFTALLLTILVGCASVEKHNKQFASLKSPELLKKDVDFVMQKLEKHHPNLYWYISKKEFDYKFDSLKATINSPLNSYDFYFKISPLVAAIRQGHTFVGIPERKLTKNEKKVASTIGITPFSKFKLELINNRLYVINNYRKDSVLKPGTEIIEVNGVKPTDIIDKYRAYFHSDGYNQTLWECIRSINFNSYYYLQNGFTDSVLCKLSYKDSTWIMNLKKEASTKPAYAAEKVVKTPKKSIKDTTYTRGAKSLKFLKPDSSIAILTIKTFNESHYTDYYARAFSKLAKTKTLIIDLRNNGGGKLSNVHELYSYLTDTGFHFIKASHQTSRVSPLTSPKRIFMPYLLNLSFKSKKPETHNVSYPLKEARLSQPKPSRFKGRVYVLTNGFTFSAASILAANLNAHKRATFVGEETGGAYNGCVAGLMPQVKLLHSNLRFQYGKVLIQPDRLTSIEGRGVFPDKEIQGTLQDRLTGKDPQLDWILKNIKAKHTKDLAGTF